MTKDNKETTTTPVAPTIDLLFYIRDIHIDESISMLDSIVTLNVTTSTHPRLGQGQYLNGYEKPQEITITNLKMNQDQIKTFRYAMNTTRRMRLKLEYEQML